MARIKGLHVDLRYSKAQLAAWDRLQAAYSSIEPVVDCVSDYRTVVTTALRLDALSAVPVKGSSHQLAPQMLSGTSQQVEILRISCRELQRLPVPTTLKQTLHLVRSPEAAAMRTKLARWSQELTAGNTEAAALVLPDVADAQRQLSFAKSSSRRCCVIKTRICGVDSDANQPPTRAPSPLHSSGPVGRGRLSSW
jgi:hypothetical protein